MARDIEPIIGNRRDCKRPFPVRGIHICFGSAACRLAPDGNAVFDLRLLLVLMKPRNGPDPTGGIIMACVFSTVTVIVLTRSSPTLSDGALGSKACSIVRSLAAKTTLCPAAPNASPALNETEGILTVAFVRLSIDRIAQPDVDFRQNKLSRRLRHDGIGFPDPGILNAVDGFTDFLRPLFWKSDKSVWNIKRRKLRR